MNTTPMSSHLLPSKQPVRRGRAIMWLLLLFVLLPIGAGAQGAQEGSTLRQLVLVMLFLAAAFTVVRYPERYRLAWATVPPTLLLLLLYAGLSVLWSEQPYVSFKRVIQLVGVALVGVALVVGGNGSYRLHRVVMPVLALGLVMAAAFSAAFPNFAFSDFGMRAFLATKNNFGQFAAICALFAAGGLAARSNGRRWPLVLMLLASLVALGLSRSATAALALAAAGVLMLALALKRRLHPSWWPPLLTMLVAALAALVGAGIWWGLPTLTEVSNSTAGLIGRDITLTGRAYLWELMMREVALHPWFGTGYGGFWLGLEGRSGQIGYLVGWGYPGQAHNGYIDILNELGVVGAALTLAFLIAHGHALTRLAKVSRSEASVHIALFVMIVVFNLAEAAMLRTTNMMWVLLMASCMEVRALNLRLAPPATAKGASASAQFA